MLDVLLWFASCVHASRSPGTPYGYRHMNGYVHNLARRPPPRPAPPRPAPPRPDSVSFRGNIPFAPCSYSSHTYKWVNAAGEAFYIKMHFKTEVCVPPRRVV